jgi:hypothetical protein
MTADRMTADRMTADRMTADRMTADRMTAALSADINPWFDMVDVATSEKRSLVFNDTLFIGGSVELGQDILLVLDMRQREHDMTVLWNNTPRRPGATVDDWAVVVTLEHLLAQLARR